ncbi:hypothetical protein AB0O07_34565 [Streptomyces sp. NPDC093085]|uniref:hypothetical protein n=1 Tax=Streptomyces sp. NPDC093085 TaxID=3155068 RepID=UPI0034376E88
MSMSVAALAVLIVPLAAIVALLLARPLPTRTPRTMGRGDAGGTGRHRKPVPRRLVKVPPQRTAHHLHL